MPPNPSTIVAIDGGAASGKSTASRALSERFHFLHADTGSYYRALTAEMLRRGIPPGDQAAIREALEEIRLVTRIHGRSALLEVAGVAHGDRIRSGEVNDAVSHFAAVPEVRAALHGFQRGQAEAAREGGFRGLVMEGRDIGSVIFPDADFRFFLHADPAERARRREREGHADKVAERDRLDSSRKVSPLLLSKGAISIDTTHLSIAEVTEAMAALIAPRFA